MNFGPVASHEQQASNEGAEDLRENVVWHFPPREALPDGEADGDGGVEVAAGDWCAGDDGERDANGKSPANLEDRAEDGYAQLFPGRRGSCEGEGCDGGDAGEAEGGCQSLYWDGLSQQAS